MMTKNPKKLPKGIKISDTKWAGGKDYLAYGELNKLMGASPEMSIPTQFELWQQMEERMLPALLMVLSSLIGRAGNEVVTYGHLQCHEAVCCYDKEWNEKECPDPTDKQMGLLHEEPIK